MKSGSELSYSTKKIYRQKGTGGARHGARGAPIFRNGGPTRARPRAATPTDLPRSSGFSGLKHALSSKANAPATAIFTSKMKAEAKTKALAKAVKGLGWKRVLIIDGAEVNANFAPRRPQHLLSPTRRRALGANVYDILRRDTLVITKAGVEALEARLK